MAQRSRTGKGEGFHARPEGPRVKSRRPSEERSREAASTARGQRVSMKIGWVGFGIMGRPMAENLLRAGFVVAGYNRTASRLESFARAGGGVEESPRAVTAASDVVVTMVSDTPDVAHVLFAEDGVAAR